MVLGRIQELLALSSLWYHHVLLGTTTPTLFAYLFRVQQLTVTLTGVRVMDTWVWGCSCFSI